MRKRELQKEVTELLAVEADLRSMNERLTDELSALKEKHRVKTWTVVTLSDARGYNCFSRDTEAEAVELKTSIVDAKKLGRKSAAIESGNGTQFLSLQDILSVSVVFDYKRYEYL